ncbi:MAG: DUF1428 domain-containing protein [Myxococcota bacterium]
MEAKETYLDGYVAAVPTKNREKFIDHSNAAAVVFREYGALKVVECWGDDVPEGEVTSMPMAVKCKEGETVCFSWILWPSKEVRDRAWEVLMKDERMLAMQDMPFDGKRMIYGGFEIVVNVD